MAGEITNRRFALWLSLTPEAGSKSIARVLDACRTRGLSPERFLALPERDKHALFRLHPRAAASLSRPVEHLEAKHGALEEQMSRLGVEWLTTQDATYPARLTERLPSPPTVLYMYGNRGLLGRETFAALSSRGISKRAAERMQRIVEQWVLRPRVLVSSHSTPAYQQSAVVPLRWGTPRILVLDCGLFRALSDDLTSEPFTTARLWRYNFDPKTDLALSACRPRDPSRGYHNRARDLLISALADDLLFIEAREGGVMEEIGLRCLKQGRSVLALEWDEYGRAAGGNLRLLEAGAKPLRE